MEMGKWYDWAVFDDDGNICCISEDVPKEEKLAYKQFVEEKQPIKK